MFRRPLTTIVVVAALAACPPIVRATTLPRPVTHTYTQHALAPVEHGTLDIFRPSSRTPAPLVVLVHGGSWVGGDKAKFSTAAPHLKQWWLDRGYVVAAVNFRLATKPGQTPEVRPGDQATDIATAIAWLDAHADTFHIDRGQPIIALGFSSGAHLVALLGADGQYLEAAGVPETRLGGTISLDVHAYDVPKALQLMKGSVVERNMGSIRHLFGATEAEQRVASPIAHIDGYVAPALLISAQPALDQPGSHGHVAGQATEHYARALRAAGHTAATLHLSDKTHSTLVTEFGGPRDPVASAVETFLEVQGLR